MQVLKQSIVYDVKFSYNIVDAYINYFELGTLLILNIAYLEAIVGKTFDVLFY